MYEVREDLSRDVFGREHAPAPIVIRGAAVSVLALGFAAVAEAAPSPAVARRCCCSSAPGDVIDGRAPLLER